MFDSSPPLVLALDIHGTILATERRFGDVLASGGFRTLVPTRHDGRVQAQQQRDEKTITIAIALVLFVLVLATGAAARWAANWAFDMTQQVDAAFAFATWCAAGLIPLVYLIRAVKR